MKSRVLAFGCLLVGGVLALTSSAQPWWRATGEGVVVKFTGSQVTGGLSQALGIVALAGTLLMLVLQVRGRRVVAAMLLLVGVGLVLAGALRLQPSADAVRSQVREISLVDAFQLSLTAWPWLFILSGALIVSGAALAMITAARWPSRLRSFSPAPSVGSLSTPTTRQSCGRRWMQVPIQPLLRISRAMHEQLKTPMISTRREATTPRCAIGDQETQWIPPNRCSNYPGRPPARFRAECSTTGGGAR
jgi:uncharacterized membrane protein (TIGR02234 family)